MGIMPMDSVKSADTPTFAMLMERIAGDPDLSVTRKHSLLCLIRTYTKMLGLDPARMVVDLKGHTDAIKKVRPARPQAAAQGALRAAGDLSRKVPAPAARGRPR